MTFGEEETSVDQRWLEITKRVFDGDRQRKINRYRKAEKQQSWFWRNLPRFLDPSLETHDKNYPMMCREASRQEINELERKQNIDKVQQ